MTADQTPNPAALWRRPPAGFCQVKHKTWPTRAKCEWPYAEYIRGNGRWACVSWCKRLTITLHRTEAEATAARYEIDEYGCGVRRCERAHRVYDLSRMHQKWGK